MSERAKRLSDKPWEKWVFVFGGGWVAWLLGLWIGHLVSCFETAFWWAKK